MANVGVNVPVPEVIGYMGSLYAQNVVLGEWMFDLDKVGVGLSRAWIFQEMVFGRLDEEAMGGLFEQLRELGRAMSQIPLVHGENGGEVLRNEPEDAKLVKAYVLGCCCVASLLTRRAFGVVAVGCEWFQAIDKSPVNPLSYFGVSRPTRTRRCRLPICSRLGSPEGRPLPLSKRPWRSCRALTETYGPGSSCSAQHRRETGLSTGGTSRGRPTARN